MTKKIGKFDCVLITKTGPIDHVYDDRNSDSYIDKILATLIRNLSD